METSSGEGQKPGFLVVVKTAAKDVFGYFFTAKFWLSVGRRVGVALVETVINVMGEKLRESKSKVRGAMGVDENDSTLASAGQQSQTPVAGMTRPYNPATPAAPRTYSPTPAWNSSAGYAPSQYAPTPPNDPGRWPGM